MSSTSVQESVNRLLADAKNQGITAIALRFADAVGTWRHLSLPVANLDASNLAAGIDFAGEPGDECAPAGALRLVPVTSTAVLDPFVEEPTLAVLCEAIGEDHAAHPVCVRSMLERASRHWEKQRGDTGLLVSADFDCWVLDDVRFECQAQQASYLVDVAQAGWNSNRDEIPNLGHKSFRAQIGTGGPQDHLVDLRNEMARLLDHVGVKVSSHACGPHGPGHLRFSIARAQPVALADAWMWFRYIAKNAAARAGRTATFMPKPFVHLATLRLPVRWHLQQNGSKVDVAAQGELCRDLTHRLCAWSAATSAFSRPTANSYRDSNQSSTRGAESAARTSAEKGIVELDRSGNHFTWLQPDTAASLYIALSLAIVAANCEPTSTGASSCAGEVGILPESIAAALRYSVDIEDASVQAGVCKGLWWSIWYRETWKRQVQPYQSRPHPMDFVTSYDI